MHCINNVDLMHRNDINYVSLLGVLSRRRGNTHKFMNKKADLELQRSQCRAACNRKQTKLDFF